MRLPISPDLPLLAALVALASSSCSEPAPVDPPPVSRGAIAGRVVGGLGAPVVGASVTTEPASKSAITDADGRFVLAGLHEGEYRVVVARDTARATVGARATPDTSDVLVRLPIWRLRFADEFDGTSIDTTRWYVEESDVSRSTNRFRRHAVTMADGRLRITSRPDTIEPGTFTGALVATREMFMYGRFEIRGRLPRGRGLWPAYWLWPLGKHEAPEIDIMEMLGHDPQLTYATYHYGDATGARKQVNKAWRGFDRSAGYYTYALEWYPGEIVWYIDDLVVFRTNTVQADEPMHFIIDTIIGGEWGGYPDATTIWPQYHDVDYVRIYGAID